MDSTAICNKINNLIKKRIYEEDNDSTGAKYKKARVDIFNDREQFYKRVKSFKLNCPITETICATLFALKGWYYSAESISMPMVTCITCKESFSVRIEKSEKPITDVRLKEQYNIIDKKRKEQILDNLFSKHKKLCPWKDIQSSASLLEIPIYLDSTSAEEMFISRCQEYFDRLYNKLPLVKPVQSTLTDEIVNSLLTKYRIRVTHSSRKHVRAILLLTLYGWRVGSSSPQDESLQCDVCDRTLGIWNYLSIDVSDTPSTSVATTMDPTSKDEVPRSSKRMRYDDATSLRPSHDLNVAAASTDRSKRVFGRGLPSYYDSDSSGGDDESTDRVGLFGGPIAALTNQPRQQFTFFKAAMSSHQESPAVLKERMLRKRVHKKVVKKCLIPQSEHISWCPWSKPRSFNQFLSLLLGPHYLLPDNTDSLASRTIDIIKNM